MLTMMFKTLFKQLINKKMVFVRVFVSSKAELPPLMNESSNEGKELAFGQCQQVQTQMKD